ncbi:MAG: hypothetical protein HQ567_11085 [Candidatus Nealsonbacteria bacterium]|nr:hypothetical protein [Candidatus Nealsonbacteria bacterium]
MLRSMPYRLLFVLGFLATVCPADRAAAQFGPYGAGRGGWGGYPYDTSRTYNTSLQQAGRQQQAAQQRAIQQNTAVQMGIRQTLSNQARSAPQQSQGQTSRDWMLQRRASAPAPSRQYTTGAPRAVSSGLPMAAATMQVGGTQQPQGVIKWPPVLMDKRFAEQRARVEVPYKKEGEPTVEDFRGMVDAAGKMKKELETLAYQISAGDYLSLQKYLDQLAGEAQQRIDAATPDKSTPAKPEPDATKEPAPSDKT